MKNSPITATWKEGKGTKKQNKEFQKMLKNSPTLYFWPTPRPRSMKNKEKDNDRDAWLESHRETPEEAALWEESLKIPGAVIYTPSRKPWIMAEYEKIMKNKK